MRGKQRKNRARPVPSAALRYSYKKWALEGFQPTMQILFGSENPKPNDFLVTMKNNKVLKTNI